MALTEIERERAANYLLKGMIADKVNLQDVGAVLLWIVVNQLPSKAVWEAAELTDEEEAKQRQIVSLRKQLTKLEGSR